MIEGYEGVQNSQDYYFNTIKEIDFRMEKVLYKIQKFSFELNKEKYIFDITQLVFLVHKLSRKVISPDSEKGKGIQDMSTPESKQ